jgi:stress response protein YsnF
MTFPRDTHTVIPVMEEHLEVRREMVDTGRTLRVRKHVEEVPAPVRESLAAETVHVERVPIGRVVDVAPSMREEGNVIVVPVIEERLVTRKELVLVEEIRLTRSREVKVAEAEVPVRRERVEVERLDPGTGKWLPEPDSPDSPPPERK